MSNFFKNVGGLEDFLMALDMVWPSHIPYPDLLLIPKLKEMANWNTFNGSRGSIKLVDKEMYTFEERNSDRLARLEKAMEKKNES